MKIKNLLYPSFYLILFFFILNTGNLEAQRRREGRSSNNSFDGTKNAFFVELLGNGILFSVNYDRRLINNFGLRAGIGYIGTSDVDGSGTSAGILTVPVTANFLLGKNGRYFEVGGGATYVSGSTDNFDTSGSGIIGTISFMYRRQPQDGGFMWKIGLTPLFGNGGFLPYWGGVGLGYCW
jgi:hypothetical protein